MSLNRDYREVSLFRVSAKSQLYRRMSRYKLFNLFRLKLFQAGYGAGYSIKEEYFEIVRIHYQFRLDFDKSSGF